MLPLPPANVVKEAIIIAFLYALASWSLTQFPLTVWANTLNVPITFISKFVLTLFLWALIWYSGMKP